MATFAILSFLLGAVLGHRFKVLVLVPAIAIGVVVTIGLGIARADDVWLIGLTGALISVSIQIGYLFGAAIFALVVTARATRIRGRTFTFKQAALR